MERLKGAEGLVEELQKYYDIYTAELKQYRDGKGKGPFLLDADMFDIVMKFTDKVDKIKKLVVPAQEPEHTGGAKVANIQDAFLKK